VNTYQVVNEEIMEIIEEKFEFIRDENYAFNLNFDDTNELD
jgi:hypothetical protein